MGGIILGRCKDNLILKSFKIMTKSDGDLPHCKVCVVEDVLRITAKTVHLRIIHVVFMADQFPSP